MKTYRQFISEAKMFRFRDEILSLKDVIKKADGKEISTDGKRWNYAIVMPDDIVFDVSQSDFFKTNLKDLTTPRTSENFFANYVEALMKTLPFNKQVDANAAIRDKKTFKERAELLLKMGTKFKKKLPYRFLSNKELKI